MAFIGKLKRYAKFWWVDMKEKPALRPKPRWMYIKHLPEIEWESVDMIFLAQYRDKSRDVGNTVKNRLVSIQYYRR